MTARDLTAVAWAGIRRRRGRSASAFAAFATGGAAAVAIAALAAGARAEILARLDALDLGVVAVHVVGEARDAKPALALADANSIERAFPFVEGAAPIRVLSLPIRLADERVSVKVVGTTPDFFRLRGAGFVRGRAFSEVEARAGAAVAVLGEEAARRLFPLGGAYGSLVNVGGNWYRVVGILQADAGASWVGSADGPGREVFLPILSTLGESRTGREPLDGVLFRVSREVDVEAAAEVLERSLRRRHEGHGGFAVSTAERWIRDRRAASGALDRLLAGLAVFSFAIAAVVTTVFAWRSTAERRTEIAVRRAVGAKRVDVLVPLLLEGAMIAAAGALVGALAGAIVSAVACAIAGWPWGVPLGRSLVVVASASAIGVAATAVPAWRAATLDPVESFRCEA